MEKPYNFAGVYPVVPTTLKDDESLDKDGLAHLINFYIDSGSHGFVVLGSGGEFPYFTFEEKLEITRIAVNEAKKRAPVIIGVGCYSFVETQSFIQAADKIGADGFLVALPSYYPLKYDDVFDFYKCLTQNTAKPILYYHYPQMTGLYFSTKQIARILSLDGVQGIKVSSLSIPEMRGYLKLVEKDISLFCGNSFLMAETLEMGGCGVICPIPSVAPKLVIACYDALRAKNHSKANELRAEINGLIPLMNSFDLPAKVQSTFLNIISRAPGHLIKTGNLARHAVIKEAIRQLGHPISAKVRSPLPQLKPNEQKAITEFLKIKKALF